MSNFGRDLRQLLGKGIAEADFACGSLMDFFRKLKK